MCGQNLKSLWDGWVGGLTCKTLWVRGSVVDVEREEGHQ